MKKTILTAMLFFAFLVIGIQSASAQYVNNDTATQLLEAEIQTVLDDPEYNGTATKGANYAYLDNKVTLFTFVMQSIGNGTEVGDAIRHGVFTHNSGNTAQGSWVTIVPLNEKNPTLTPLHQELEDLLTQ